MFCIYQGNHSILLILLIIYKNGVFLMGEDEMEW